MQFLLFTSIKPPATPSELAYLCDCLNSWRAAGFEAVSVNGPSEIERLRGLDLSVKFAPVAADGKPRIGAILGAIRDCGAPFAGIINADCRIALRDIADNIQGGLKGRLALAWRADVDGEKIYASSLGFDAFFFDTAILPDNDFDFSIGEAWWDLWFPLACERTGAAIEVLPPLLTHRVHPQAWSQLQYERNGSRVWKWCKKVGLPSMRNLRAFNSEIPALFHPRPQTISITGSYDSDTMLRVAGRALIRAHDEDEMDKICNSLYWKIRSGLRRINMPVWLRQPRKCLMRLVS